MTALAAAETKPQWTVVQSRVIDLLSRGYSQEIAASALGITPGRVSQILEDQELRSEIATRRTANLEAFSDHDELLDKTESKVLNQLHSVLGRVQSPMEAARIFSLLNNAKRRSRPESTEPSVVQHTTVNLTLPSQVVHKYRANDQGQVIEIDGKLVQTLPSNKLEEVARNAHPDLQRQARKAPLIRSSGDSAEISIPRPATSPEDI